MNYADMTPYDRKTDALLRNTGHGNWPLIAHIDAIGAATVGEVVRLPLMHRMELIAEMRRQLYSTRTDIGMWSWTPGVGFERLTPVGCTL